MLVTGTLKQLHDGGVANCLTRYPWKRGPAKQRIGKIEEQWKLCTRESYIESLWNFWYKCGPAHRADRAAVLAVFASQE